MKKFLNLSLADVINTSKKLRVISRKAALVLALVLLGTAGLYSQTYISTPGDWTNFVNRVTSGSSLSTDYYVLDIDIGVPGSPVPSPTTPIGGILRGIFYGNNKRINVAINSNLINVGLFSEIGSSGAIESLVIEGYVTGGTNSQNVGGFAGLVSGSYHFHNCSNLSAVSCTNSNASVGGIVGKATAHCGFNICSNNGIITGGSAVAGIVGTTTLGFIHFCKNAGLIKTNSANPVYMAGIVANCNTPNGVNIHGAVNIGKIESANSAYAGGIVAYLKNSNVFSSLNAGIVDGAKTAVGGIVGYVDINPATLMDVRHCLNTNWVTASATATNSGAIVGFNSGGYIDSCYFDNQMCTLNVGVGVNSGGTVTAVSGLPTTSMLGTSFGGSFLWWNRVSNLYPTPNDNINQHPIQLLAAAPIRLQGGERLDNVRTDFFVSNEWSLIPPLFVPPPVSLPISLSGQYFYQWGWFNPIKLFSLNNFVEIVSPNIATIRIRGGWDSLAVRLTQPASAVIYEKVIPINVRP